jgi:hypothetical protein
MVLPAQRGFESRRRPSTARQIVWNAGTLDDFIAAREKERAQFVAQRPRRRRAPVAARASAAPLVAVRAAPESAGAEIDGGGTVATPPPTSKPLPKRPRRSAATVTSAPGNGSARRTGRAAASSETPDGERSGIHSRGTPRLNDDRRKRERRRRAAPIPFPDRRLTRSAYEQVFLKLVSGERLRIGREMYTPVGMKGWYHAVFRRDSDGHERLLTIDQLLRKMKDWQ